MRPGSSRSTGRSRRRRPSRHRKTCSSTCAPRNAHVERQAAAWWATPTRRWPARRRSSKPNTTSRSRDTRRSVRRMPLADPSNGQMTIYSNDMKSYGMRNGVAQFLGMPRDQVRVVWMEGPQGYGRTAADDAGFEAAYLAKEIGRPVRVQWMRHEETAWDTKGPAFTFKMRGGLDAQGNLVALDYDAQAADYNHLGYNEPDTVLIAQLMGIRRSPPNRGGGGHAFGHVRHPEPAHGHPGREPAAGVGDAASHRKPAGSQRSAGDVRRRVVHRRAGGGGEGRSGRVPHEAPHGQHRRRQRVQAGALHRRASRRRRRRMAGTRVLPRNRSAPETFSPGAGSRTPSAARPSSRRSPRSR